MVPAYNIYIYKVRGSGRHRNQVNLAMMLAQVQRAFRGPRKFIPLSLAAGSIGLAFYGGSIRNDTGTTFKGGDEWIDLKLAKSWNISPDTKHFIFALDDKEHVSGLITASCLMAKFVTPKGNNVIRPYTPISDVNTKGFIEFAIKKYDDGKMSPHMHDLKENDTMSFKGPIVKWKWEPNQYKTISLIGGGSGITPLYQLLYEVTKNPEDKTKVQLFYGNKSEDDILIKKELDEIANKHKDQVEVQYFVDKPLSNWNGNSGFITKDFLKSKLPKPSPDQKIFVCGPPPMYKALSGMKVSPTDQGELTGALAELGYTKENVYKF